LVSSIVLLLLLSLSLFEFVSYSVLLVVIQLFGYSVASVSVLVVAAQTLRQTWILVRWLIEHVLVTPCLV